MSTALWYLDCERGEGEVVVVVAAVGWEAVRHAIHCWVVFLWAYRMSFKICQLRQLSGRYPKWYILHRLSSWNSHALHNKQFELDTFFTHRVELRASHVFLHRCHKVMRALQSHRLNYILKRRTGGGRMRGGNRVFTAQDNVTVMKCQDTGMESS